MCKASRYSIGLLSLMAAACSSNTGEIGKTPTGGGGSGTKLDALSLGDPTGTGVTTDPGGSGNIGKLTVVVRDFRMYKASDKSTNPDFENVPATDSSGNPSTTYLGPWDDLKIVTDTLGGDNLPVYANASGQSLSTHGKAAFDQWFRDVKGTNIRVEYPLELVKDGNGNYAYDSQVSGVATSGSATKMFFPIDDGTAYKTAFGNEGREHNYSFTVEMHTKFTYAGGEFFHFRGDDDVFVYINKKLVINLGGIHGAEPADVQVDSLGLTKGMEYPLDFFYAERHVVASNLLVTTSLALTPAIIF